MSYIKWRNSAGAIHRSRPGSLTSRIIAFYKANPGAELTFTAARLKFGCTLSALSMAVKRMTDSGHLESPRVIRIPRK